MKIGLEHVGDLARGAAILGTGGGGDPYLGSLMLRQAIRDHGPIDLIDVEQLGDDDFVVPFAMMGAPTVLVEKLPNGAEMVAALRAMERYRGEQASAILCAEIGGINALLPLVLAARCGLPVVDGDGMGRAFPQLQMVTYHIFGVPLSPMVMTDEYSNTVLFECAEAQDAERLGRNLVVAMGGSSSNCLYPMHGRDAKRSMVRSTLSLALGLGRSVREARRSSVDPSANCSPICAPPRTTSTAVCYSRARSSIYCGKPRRDGLLDAWASRAPALAPGGDSRCSSRTSTSSHAKASESARSCRI